MIIEDEALIALQLKTFLSRRGLHVVGYAADYSEAYALFEAHQPEIIICDIRLKEHENGIEIVRQLRELGVFEVIFLTSYSDTATLQHAFETAPFSYITKPFKEIDVYTSLMLCVAKLKEQRSKYGYFYNPDTKMLYRDDAPVLLSKQEADLFHLCYLNKGHFVPMALIDDTLWGQKNLGESTRRGLFHRLAKKIGKELFEYHAQSGCKVNL